MTSEELFAAASECDPNYLDTHHMIGQGLSMEHRAVECLHAHGAADDHGGTVESPTGHYVRVAQWIAYTDNLGFKYIEEHATEADAVSHFLKLEEEYCLWAGDDQ